MDRGVCWATVQRVAKSWMQLMQLSMHARGDRRLNATQHVGFDLGTDQTLLEKLGKLNKIWSLVNSVALNFLF